MADELVVEPLVRKKVDAYVVEQWPKRTAFHRNALEPEYQHLGGIMVDREQGTVTVSASNGAAIYRLRPDVPYSPGYMVADLMAGDTPSRLKQLATKYLQPKPTPPEPT